MSNFNLNKAILGGRMTADVELKQTQSGVAVCSFSIAVNRRVAKDAEQQVDFINCVAWRQTAVERSGRYGTTTGNELHSEAIRRKRDRRRSAVLISKAR